jgi:hypothetical protein
MRLLWERQSSTGPPHSALLGAWCGWKVPCSVASPYTTAVAWQQVCPTGGRHVNISPHTRRSWGMSKHAVCLSFDGMAWFFVPPALSGVSVGGG